MLAFVSVIFVTVAELPMNCIPDLIREITGAVLFAKVICALDWVFPE